MKPLSRSLALLVVLAGVGFASTLAAQARFADPVLLQAEGKKVGTGRYYPSPALHDLDGDGRQDLLIGDLFGEITVAYAKADGSGYKAESKLLAANGERLKFNNW